MPSPQPIPIQIPVCADSVIGEDLIPYDDLTTCYTKADDTATDTVADAYKLVKKLIDIDPVIISTLSSI